MPLFKVDDNDRPAFVFARTYAEAIEKWETVIREENDGEIAEPPKGVAFICDDDEIIGVDRINAA